MFGLKQKKKIIQWRLFLSNLFTFLSLNSPKLFFPQNQLEKPELVRKSAQILESVIKRVKNQFKSNKIYQHFLKILFSEKNLLDGNEESLTHDRFPNDLTLRYKSSSLYIFPPLHQNQNFVLFTCRYVCIICNVSYQAALNGGKRRCSTSSERETNLFKDLLV